MEFISNRYSEVEAKEKTELVFDSLFCFLSRSFNEIICLHILVFLELLAVSRIVRMSGWKEVVFNLVLHATQSHTQFFKRLEIQSYCRQFQ